jgi:tetratricopeptide (TPR) repeat protein
MWIWRASCVAIAVAGTVALARSAEQQIPSSIFDRYAQGDFKGAVDVAAADREFSSSKKTFERQALAWIAMDSTSVERRRLAVATFALEFVRVKLETEPNGWLRFRDLVEWSCAQLRAGQKPALAEHAWMRASIALAQRVRDILWLTGLASPGRPVDSTPRHLEHAEHRFPDESRFRLARAVLDTYGADRDLSFRMRVISQTQTAKTGEIIAREATDKAVRSFDSLLRDPLVHRDAELHIAHLYLEAHQYEQAADYAARAAELSHDSRLTYIAQIVRGQALAGLGRSAEAGRAYAQALESIPGGQSATLALSGWLLLSGQRQEAFDLTRRAFSTKPAEDDPWRLYYYGDFMYWPDLMRELHEAIR